MTSPSSCRWPRLSPSPSLVLVAAAAGFLLPGPVLASPWPRAASGGGLRDGADVVAPPAVTSEEEGRRRAPPPPPGGDGAGEPRSPLRGGGEARRPPQPPPASEEKAVASNFVWSFFVAHAAAALPPPLAGLLARSMVESDTSEASGGSAAASASSGAAALSVAAAAAAKGEDEDAPWSAGTVERLEGFLMWFIIVFCFGLYYRSAKAEFMPQPLSRRPVRRDVVLLERHDWGFGLLCCHEEPRLCLFSCCCCAVRWADTMSMVGLLTFMGALEIYVWANFASTLLTQIILLAVLMYYRQKLRARFDIPNGSCSTIAEDCLAMTCCTVCAITQEARQVELASKLGHKSCAKDGFASGGSA